MLVHINSDDSISRLRQWAETELAGRVGASREDARRYTEAALQRLVERQRRRGAGELSDHFRSEMVSAVTVARATDLCHGRSAWWRDDGEPALRSVEAGRFHEAQSKQAEFLAGPFDLDVDCNWPSSKLFRVGGLDIGEAELRRMHQDTVEVVLGNGEGNRAPARVEEVEGNLGLVAIDGTFRNPTSDLWAEAFDEASRLATD